MSKKSRRRKADRDNPEWTAADFKRARPAREVVPNIVATYLRKKAIAPKSTATRR